ncbi:MULTISPECIES: molecular chaperone [unclassified Acinetobacter]|uniref:fimbrial biogenesis chaperone n=1 Tax=unclassified Acinetobacter TaxID=196816 RepID=UPI001C2102D0|nr:MULTISPECIES: fimbria/pilus periplasmic chaperone [unclassified Acinetobacter]
MHKKIIGFFLLLLCSATLSAGIKFSPIQLYIQDFKKQRSTTVNIESTGVKFSKIYEISAFKWQQDERGEDILVEDNTLLFNPRTFELKPESKQIVRIGFSQPLMDTEKQQAWRVIFKEVTPVDDTSTINFLFNFSLPLFAGKQLPPQLNVNLEKVNDLAYLKVDNKAKSHAKIVEVIVLDSNNNEVLKKDLTQYVLSGNKIKFEIGEIKTTGNLKLKIKVEEYGEYLEYPINA